MHLEQPVPPSAEEECEHGGEGSTRVLRYHRPEDGGRDGTGRGGEGRGGPERKWVRKEGAKRTGGRRLGTGTLHRPDLAGTERAGGGVAIRHPRPEGEGEGEGGGRGGEGSARSTLHRPRAT